MLEAHMKDVQDYLIEKKEEYEEMNDVSSRADDQIPAVEPLKSPPALGRGFTPRTRQGSVPKMGYFTVPSHSPSPRSPLKRGAFKDGA
jgi:histone deacetylase 6